MDDLIAAFVSFTQADPDRAAQYLQLADNNLEHAIELYFESPNLDLGATTTAQETSSTSQVAQPSTTTPAHPANLINLDSDDDEMEVDEDTGDTSSAPGGTSAAAAAPAYEDDEAMARRLQEEMYGAGGAEADIRAPIARTSETLIGPGSTWTPNTDDLDALVAEQLAARSRRLAGV
jgi:hypothetical protein